MQQRYSAMERALDALHSIRRDLVHAARSLAKVLAPHGITVNAVSPGILETPGFPRFDLDSLLERIPAGHLGQIEDVVAAARFLLSDEAGYVTGTNVHVSGGWGL